MKTNYNQFEKRLERSIKNVCISGTRIYDPRVSLLKVDKGNWKNLWSEKAVYELVGSDCGDKFSGFTCYSHMKYGEFVVRKKKNKLLVDLMTTYKTRRDQNPIPLTIENSFEIPLE